MPAGLVNALASRQQFLDLVRYLMEIAEHGPARARALRPDPALVAPPLPEYERKLDHAGLIAGLGPEQLPARRGDLQPRLRQLPRHQGPARLAADRASVRLRGAQERQRSLPHVSHAHRRLRPDGAADLDGPPAEVRRDPLHPRGLSEAPQPGPVRPVDRAYLDQLPKGTSRGPAPSEIEPWVAMDYGPSLMATYEVGSDGSNFAYKGIAVRLDPGQGGVSRGRPGSSTTTTRSAWPPPGPARASSTGTASTSTAGTRSIPGSSARSRSPTPTVPAGPTRTIQSFADLRLRGRDGRPYGPLPRRWAHYQGLYHHGDQVILAYTVGTTEILETPGLETDPAHPDVPIFTRTLEIGPSPHELDDAGGPRGGRRQPGRRSGRAQPVAARRVRSC